jgi:hypothetical protein
MSARPTPVATAPAVVTLDLCRSASLGVSDSAPGGVEFFYRWAGVRARSDCPSVHELVEAGWEPVAHDTRYGSTLCRLDVR